MYPCNSVAVVCVTLFSSVTYLLIEVINENHEGAKTMSRVNASELPQPMLGKNKKEGDSRVSWRRPRGMGPVGFEP